MIETLIQQYLAPVVLWFIGLFTLAEWRAFVLLIAVTISATHTVKLVWRLSPVRGGSHGQVNLASAIIGFSAAPFVWPSGFSWWIPAVLAGPVSVLVFKISFWTLKKFMPGFAATLNMDRRKEDMGPPPDGIGPRRKEDKDP